MADVSLDDYILRKGSKFSGGPVTGTVVIPNHGVKSRLGGGANANRNKNTGLIRSLKTAKQTVNYVGSKNIQQVGLTTKKFAGGLVTKKFANKIQGPNKGQAKVTVTGVGSFDARQKIATKQPVGDARAKIMAKTKFVDARVRIQYARAKKEPGPTPGGQITNIRTRSPQTGNHGNMTGGQSEGSRQLTRTVNNDFIESTNNTGTSRFGAQYRGPAGDGQQVRGGGGGIQLRRGGELMITKPRDPNGTKFTPQLSNVTISSARVPSGYEDLFEDEPMSLGSDCYTTMDSKRGPVIQIKNEHFTKPKPTPITFSTGSSRRASPITYSRQEPQITRTLTPDRFEHQEHQITRRLASDTYSRPEQQITRRFSTAKSELEEEDELLLSSPPAMPPPKKQPIPMRMTASVEPVAQPLSLHKSRPSTLGGTETRVGSVAPPPVGGAPLKLFKAGSRPTASVPVTIQEAKKPVLMSSSALSAKQIDESGPADVLSPLQGFRIQVTNLHLIVTQDDVIELFGAIGALKKARLVKQGSAEVVYVKKEDAISAVKKYHNRELDGQPMQVKLLTSVSASAAPGPKISAEIKALAKAAKDSSGKSTAPPVDTGLIHKALFKTGGTATGTKPVTFTVKI